MTLPRRDFLRLAAGAAALPATPRVARADTYPSRPVHLIIGYAPGGSADMTARLLLARMSAPDDLGWTVLLRACGAHESFIRTHGWAAESDRVAEFLLLDRLFPRSVVHALSTAEECLAALNPGAVRAGVDDPARRPVGRLRNRLEYADPRQLTAQLPELLSTLQETCVEASEAITRRYFQYEAPVAWERGG